MTKKSYCLLLTLFAVAKSYYMNYYDYSDFVPYPFATDLCYFTTKTGLVLAHCSSLFDRPGYCPATPYCGYCLPRFLTSRYECYSDLDCPRSTKCCHHNCYRHKICLPAVLHDVTAEEETTRDTEETTTVTTLTTTSKSTTRDTELTTMDTTTEATTASTTRSTTTSRPVTTTRRTTTIEEDRTTSKPTPTTTTTTTKGTTEKEGSGSDYDYDDDDDDDEDTAVPAQ